MLRKKDSALCMGHFAVAVTLILFLTTQSAALDLSIIESGPESDAEVGLWVAGLQDAFPAVSRLVSPSGHVFTPDSILEEGSVSDLVIHFDSVSDAIDYVEGTWQAMVAPHLVPWPEPPATDTFEFTIEGIPSEAINRTAPSLIAPSPGAVIRNGSTFTFGWDYLTSGDAPNRTSIVLVPQFDPIRGWSRSIVSTPTPGSTTQSSGGIGSGDQMFTKMVTNVPGVDRNRFLWTLEASEAALPLDVEVTLGSFILLDDVVTLGDTTGLEIPPFVNLVYSRQRDPFVITLSTVPEPSSIGIMIVLVIGGSLIRLRVAGQCSEPRRVGSHA